MNDQVQRNVAAIVEFEKNVEAHRSWSARIGAAIAGFVGTMSFVVLHLVIIAVWLFLNRRNASTVFDSYPWPVLILALEVEAIVLSAFVLMTQRPQTKVADRRSHLNLQINLLAEAEMTKVINTLRTISVHLGLPDEAGDEGFQDLAGDTDVEHVAKALDEQMGDEAARTDTTPEPSPPASR
jgi:uncharacterized membrane protein